MEVVSSADGTRIAFERHGCGDPLLLVHGTTGSSRDWALVAPILAERFTVVGMDRRGHGESDAGPAHSVGLEAQDVLAVVEALDEPVHLVGHSGGARAALAAAPLTDRLRTLVLYEPPISSRGWPPGLPDRVDALIRDGFRDEAAETFLREVAAVTEDEIAVLRRVEPVWERITGSAHNGSRDQRAFTAEPVDLDAARRITVPVLLLVGGDQDAPVYLEGLDELQQALCSAVRAEIPGQGHLAAGFAPEDFAALVIDFIGDGAGRV